MSTSPTEVFQGSQPTLSKEEWLKQFKPWFDMPNHLKVIDDPMLPVWESLRNLNRIWSFTDYENHRTISPGLCLLTATGYYITDVPWTKDTPDIIWLKPLTDSIIGLE